MSFFPRISLTTGIGEAGTHVAAPTFTLEVPPQHSKRTFSFKPLVASEAAYDSSLEILPDRLDRLTSALRNFEYEVDLYAAKSSGVLRAP